MSCVIPLSHLSTQVGTVSWSEDQRIAVTTSEAICIETLMGVCHAHSSETRPPFTISTALAPSRHTLPLLSGCTTTTTAIADYLPKPGTMTRFLDPLLASGGGNQSRDLFVASDWSPAGCNHLGGCLLSCVTFSGRLLLFSPPGSTSTHWRTIADVTHVYSTLLAAHLPQQQPADCEEPSPKRAKCDVTAGADLIGKRMAVACSVHAWLPAVLSTGREGRTAVVAMATRSGDVILWSLQVPLPARSAGEELPLSLLRTLQLPPPAETWACSLRWHHRTTASAAHLTVGCTNGMVLDFQWSKFTIDAGGEISEPSLATLWPCADGIPVHHVAWQTKSPSRGRGWVVINKGSSLVALSSSEVTAGVGTSTSPPPPHLLVCGLHNMPVSGLCALSDGTFISSSLDSTVQRFTLPTTPPSHGKSCASHVTPEPIAIVSLSAGHAYTSQGIAVSQNGIFVAAAMNPQCDFSYKKKKYRSELHLITIAGGSEVERRLKHAVVCEWDICEHLRQESAETMVLPAYVQKLVARWSEDMPLPQLQFQLQMCHISREQAGADEKCATLTHTILRRHAVSSLHTWRWWVGEGTVTDGQSAMSLHLMGQWLLSTGNSHQQLAQEVVARLPVESRHPEICPLCGTSIPFTNPRGEECSSGHKWKRCSITLCLATDPQCSGCVQCGAPANNVQSLAAQPGTWLHHLLCTHPLCILCKGHFEQVV